jgi:hypothetical protein
MNLETGMQIEIQSVKIVIHGEVHASDFTQITRSAIF